MKKFIETLKNCWKIEDLRQRILITITFFRGITGNRPFNVAEITNANQWRSYVAVGYVLRWCIF